MANEQILPNGWRYESIGALETAGIVQDVQDGNHGEKHPKATDYVPSGVPFVMARDIEGNRLNLKDCAFITRSLADSLRIGFARPGDVLLTHKATMGRVAVVPEGYDYIMLTPQVTYYRVGDSTRLSNIYLKYAFLGPDFQHQLNSDSDQSTRRYIGITAQRRLRITLPPLKEQQAIAYVLGTLDRKLESNRMLNETLEDMARALFKSWFVDFEPVRAKANGRLTNLPQSIADLFPDSFSSTEKGEIPRGWQLRPIGDIATVSGGSTPSTKEPSYWDDGTHNWATPKDLSALKTPVLLDTERRITNAGLAQITSGLLPVGTVLLSSRAPIGYLAVAEIPVAINQGFIAMRPTAGVSNLFLLRWAEWAHEFIVSRANGSTFLEISKSSFRPILVIIPSDALMGEFDRIARPLYSRMVCNEVASRTLAKIRDALLPKLISGELRIPDAERIVGAQT